MPDCLNPPKGAAGSCGGAIYDDAPSLDLARHRSCPTRVGGDDIGLQSVGRVVGDLSASQNQMHAAATGNRADGNLLTVDANSIDTGRPASGAGLPPGTVGTAMTSDDGFSSTTAAFSVQNVQEVDAGISAVTSGAGTMLAESQPSVAPPRKLDDSASSSRVTFSQTPREPARPKTVRRCTYQTAKFWFDGGLTGGCSGVIF